MKKKIILILSISLLLICGCSPKNSDAIKFKEEYESLNEQKTSTGKDYLNTNIETSNPMVYSSFAEIINIINNNETAIVYFGFAECPWCRNTIPVLLDALKEEGIEKAYYVHSQNERGKKSVDDNGNVVIDIPASEDYIKLLTLLDEYLPDYALKDINGNYVSGNEKRIYSPSVLFIKEGKIVGIYSGSVESQTDPYIALTDDQKTELKNNYKKYIEETTTCDESC